LEEKFHKIATGLVPKGKKRGHKENKRSHQCGRQQGRNAVKRLEVCLAGKKRGEENKKASTEKGAPEGGRGESEQLKRPRGGGKFSRFRMVGKKKRKKGSRGKSLRGKGEEQGTRGIDRLPQLWVNGRANSKKKHMGQPTQCFRRKMPVTTPKWMVQDNGRGGGTPRKQGKGAELRQRKTSKMWLAEHCGGVLDQKKVKPLGKKKGPD